MGTKFYLRDLTGDLDVDERIILKWILKQKS